MRLIQAYINGITRLNNAVGTCVSYLVYAMFFFLILEVFFRYAMESPTVWTNELTQLLFGFYIVMSGGYVMAHREHVNVDIFYSHFSTRTKAIVNIFTSVLFFLFVGSVLYFGSSMAWESIQSMETSYSAWNPPIWPVKAAIPVAAFLLLLQGIARLLEDIGVALNLMPAPVHKHASSGEHS